MNDPVSSKNELINTGEPTFPSDMPQESFGHILGDLFRAMISAAGRNNIKQQKRYIREFAGIKKGHEFSFEAMDSILQKVGKYGGIRVPVIAPDSYYWKKFQVLLSGMLSLMNMEPMNALATDTRDEEDKNDKIRLDKNRQSLEEDWGITDEKTTFDTIQWLLMEGHSKEYELSSNPQQLFDIRYNELIELLEDRDESEEEKKLILEYYLNIEKINIQNRFDFFNYFKDKYSPEDMRAWDIGRAVNIVRWCYTVGYIDENISWKYMDSIGRMAVSCFHSFAEYAKSYVFGRFFWIFYKIEKEQQLYYIYHLLKTTEKLFKNKKGDWLIHPWIEKVR